MEVIEIQDRDIFVMGDIHGVFHEAYVRDGINHACIILAGDCGFGFHHFKYYTGCMYQKAHRMITWSDWIDTQPDSYDGYDEWLKSKGLRRNNRNAQQFIREIEDSLTE